ncbi:hypothetical protein [Agaricicola taiwanensis]|nr:hypothetical protein [Agaricicola taiwanensis]
MISAVVLAAVAALPLSPALAEEWKRPDSPFTMGEAHPEVPATCETARHWIDHAPATDDRVSFAIEGALVAVHWDGVLAYLIMCDEPGVQVMCVTYSKEGREVGNRVMFAGGYIRAGERRIMLDPCLASSN